METGMSQIACILGPISPVKSILKKCFLTLFKATYFN